MKFTFTEKKMDSSEALRTYAQEKVSKLDRYFRKESSAYITFSIDKHKKFCAEITLENNGMFFRVSEVTGDMYASVDSACALIERQIHKNKTRLAKQLRADSPMPAPEAVPEEPEEHFTLARTKRFQIKPMSVEEAILQMNLLEHSFYAFRNADEDGAFSVVYARNDGGYGLITDEKE